jgi:hypothetical protein
MKAIRVKGTTGMSTGGHWFDPETAEQYLEKIGSLRRHTTEAYDEVVTQDLKQIEARLEALASTDETLAAQTHQQLVELADYVGRFKRQTAAALLALEQEAKQIHDALEKTVKKQSSLDTEKLELEKSKLQLERWKVVLGAIAVFLTGLAFPFILWQLGVTP